MKEFSLRYTIKDLPADTRPRERMAAHGPASLSNAELLAIILRTGNREQTALELASRILAEPGGLRYLTEATLEELSKFKGVGLAKASQIKAAFELGKRISSMTPETRPVIKSPEHVAQLVMEDLRNLDRETFHIVCLNTKNQVVKTEMISKGSLNSSLVHPREVFKTAISRSAAAVILVHNHPSGDPSPSPEDLKITRRLVEVGELVGIEVLDHLIIGQQSYISLKEKGHM